MKEQITVQLKNSNPETWRTWKDLESHLSDEALEKGLELSDIQYDEDDFSKTCICTFNDPISFQNGVIKMQRCAIKHGLHVELLEKLILETEGLQAITNYRREKCVRK